MMGSMSGSLHENGRVKRNEILQNKLKGLQTEQDAAFQQAMVNQFIV